MKSPERTDASLTPWEVLESEVLLDRKWLRLRQERVRTQSGVVIDEFHVIESAPWAATICVTEDRQLVLVEQYRHGHRGCSLELPAGVIEPEEAPLRGAERELREETGYEADDWSLLWKIRPEPARHEQWAYFAVARSAKPTGPQSLDSTEHLRVVLRPLEELDQIVAEMVQGLHVGALLLAERRGLLGSGSGGLRG